MRSTNIRLEIEVVEIQKDALKENNMVCTCDADERKGS